MSAFETIGNRRIYFNQTYYLSYAGGSRELPAKAQKEWDKTKNLPFLLMAKEQNKISYANRPGVIPLQGIQLISFIRELKFVPLFDKYFDKTNLLLLTDLIAYESIRQKSYDLAMGK